MHHALMRFVRMYFVSKLALLALVGIDHEWYLQDGEFDETVFRPTLFLENESGDLQAGSSGKANQESRAVAVTDRMPLILQVNQLYLFTSKSSLISDRAAFRAFTDRSWLRDGRERRNNSDSV
jgi:hypothetical protein